MDLPEVEVRDAKRRQFYKGLTFKPLGTMLIAVPVAYLFGMTWVGLHQEERAKVGLFFGSVTTTAAICVAIGGIGAAVGWGRVIKLDDLTALAEKAGDKPATL